MLFDQVVRAASWPEFEKFHAESKHVHDWRTYIPAELELGWKDIPLEARLYMVAVAQYAADKENWD